MKDIGQYFSVVLLFCYKVVVVLSLDEIFNPLNTRCVLFFSSDGCCLFERVHEHESGKNNRFISFFGPIFLCRSPHSGIIKLECG